MWTGRDPVTDTEKVIGSLVKQVYVWNMPDANLVYCIGVSGICKGFSPLFVGIPRLFGNMPLQIPSTLVLFYVSYSFSDLR